MYELKKISYNFDALEPVIDAKTIEIHHTKHHQNYLNKLNDIIKKNNLDVSKSLEELILDVDQVNDADKVGFLFNIGGVINHDLYFEILKPGGSNEISGSLKEGIESSFGSVDAFIEEFAQKASTLMGSGWVFLALNPNKELELVRANNQESPISHGFDPIMVIDVWEHAYYLKYQNLRPDYVTNFLDIVNFDVVKELYDEKVK